MTARLAVPWATDGSCASLTERTRTKRTPQPMADSSRPRYAQKKQTKAMSSNAAIEGSGTGVTSAYVVPMRNSSAIIEGVCTVDVLP